MAIDPRTIKRKTQDGDSVEFFSPSEQAAKPLTNRQKLARAQRGAAGRIRVILTRRTSY